MEIPTLVKKKNKSSHLITAIWKKFEWLTDHLGVLCGALTLVMTIAVMREVIGRYIFNEPSDWSLELSCYLVVALGYLAAGSTQLAEGHVRVDMFYMKFPKKFKNYVDIFISLICLSWSAILVKQGWDLAYGSLVKGAHSSEAMMWPLFPSQVMIPIGALIIALIFIGQIVKTVNNIVKGAK